MSDKSHLPKRSDFPPEADFVIKEFDVPLVRIAADGWFNWFGGTPQPYDPSSLRVDNNWPARTFEEWVGIVAASTAGRQDRSETENRRQPESSQRDKWNLFESDEP